MSLKSLTIKKPTNHKPGTVPHHPQLKHINQTSPNIWIAQDTQTQEIIKITDTGSHLQLSFK